jgi:hypothetical protein
MHCQSRGPDASLVTTAACCPVKEGALTIRFWRARPASASIQDAYMAFPARSLPRIPVMSPMPPLQEVTPCLGATFHPRACAAVVSCRCVAGQPNGQNRLAPASQRHLRLLSLFSAHSPFLHLIQ